VHRPVHTTTAEQRLIRRRDNNIHVLIGDVTENNLDRRHIPIIPTRGTQPTLFRTRRTVSKASRAD
jgi:hypothetical protein